MPYVWDTVIYIVILPILLLICIGLKTANVKCQTLPQTSTINQFLNVKDTVATGVESSITLLSSFGALLRVSRVVS